MPFTRDSIVLQRLFVEATENPDVAEQWSGLTVSQRKWVHDGVSEQAEVIWDTAAAEIRRFEELEAKLRDDQELIAAKLPPAPVGHGFLKSYSTVFLPAVPGLLILAYVIAGFAVGWATPFEWLMKPVVLALLACGVAIGAVMFWRYVSLSRDHQRRVAEELERGRQSLRIDETQRRLAEAKQAILAAARDKGLLSLLRRLIGERLTPSYATTLSITEAPGLDSAYSSSLEVTTPAHRRLRGILDSWGGGSIGIAGPRGAGKSTLIQSFCRDREGGEHARAVLGVAISAPVEYQGRDFMLHLFASFCHRVLERADAAYTRFDWKQAALPTQPLRRDIFRMVLTSSMICVFFAVVLMIGASGLAALNLSAQADDRAAQARALEVSKVASTPSNAAVVVAATPVAAAARFFKELEVKPSGLFTWSYWLLLVGVLCFVIAERRASRVAVAPSEMPIEESALPKPIRFSDLFPFNIPRKVHALQAVFAEPQPEMPVSRSVLEARAWLTEIKFQQSFTAGWSGSAKLPIGLEGSTTRGRAMAQTPLTLPEIVDGFTRFLRQVALDLRCAIVIGIDELDKLESDDKAQRFLNEIKAIFGVDGVYYLVSVSESAMSSFERRGLPFRDAFDSAFDEVVAVDYLSFDNARRLLSERVVGMPVPFQALCFCLSGGLARELLRTCRDLVEQGADTAITSNLATLTGVLVRLDLNAKLSAARHAAEQLRLEPQRSDLLQQLYQLTTVQVSAAALHQAHANLLAGSEPEQAGDAPESPQTKLHALALETGSYIYYLATMLEFFTDALDQPAMERAAAGRIDEFAHALQSLAVSPRLTCYILDTLRLRK